MKKFIILSLLVASQVSLAKEVILSKEEAASVIEAANLALDNAKLECSEEDILTIEEQFEYFPLSEEEKTTVVSVNEDGFQPVIKIRSTVTNIHGKKVEGVELITSNADLTEAVEYSFQINGITEGKENRGTLVKPKIVKVEKRTQLSKKICK